MAFVETIKPEQKMRLRDYNPGDTAGVSREEAEMRLADLNSQLGELQEMLYAAQKNSVLIILQGLDTAGKDGTIRHVMAQFNPAACRVESFKVPTPIELAHDFLWRAHLVTPPRGVISIFNRSYYEDVLVVRVHNLVPEQVWRQRFEQINHFESLLAASGTIMLKFFLCISKEEQRERLRAREEDKEKAWKLSASDWPEHERYGDYVAAYEEALSRCSTAHAPWYLVPANHKWFRNLAVAQTLVDVLNPFASRWKAELEERGRANLAALAAAHQAQQGKGSAS